MIKDQHISREGDVVLIHYEDKPAVYARIEAIELDIKKDWYQVTLLLLTFPVQTVTWILREEYINGASFTMNGQPIRLEKLYRVSVQRESEEDSHSFGHSKAEKSAKVIPFLKKS